MRNRCFIILKLINIAFIFVLYLHWMHWGSDVWLFRIHKYSIHFCIIHLFKSFLVIVFLWYKQDLIDLISFSKFSDKFLAFTFARAIGNLWSICLGVNNFSPFPCFSFIGDIPILILGLHKSVCTFISVSFFLYLLLIFLYIYY